MSIQSYVKLDPHYIILREDEETCIVCGVYTDEQTARHEFYTRYIEAILQYNRYGCWHSHEMLVRVDDLVKAIENDWDDVIIKANTRHSVQDMNMVASDLLAKFAKFEKESVDYMSSKL